VVLYKCYMFLLGR